MSSIGNDIVDLQHIDKKRTCERRFFSKILSETEQQLLSHTTLPPYIFVWLLWAAKEAVYKYLKRLQPGLVFSPVKISLLSDLSSLIKFQNNVSEGAGFSEEETTTLEMHFQNKNFFVRAIIAPHFIATFTANDFDAVQWGIKQIEGAHPETQSAAVRQLLTARLQKLYPQGEFVIMKSQAGYPVIDGQTSLVTFAHHGHYVAYAFTK